MSQTQTPRRAPPLDRTGRVLRDTLAYARERNYTGWDYGDGMSSRLLRSLPFEHKYLNLAVQETIKRAPVNVRPLFLVEQRRNYKGTALFTLANLGFDRYLDAQGVEGDVDYRAEARALADWLIEDSRSGYAGFCGGHRHQIQFMDYKGLPEYPDVVSTTYGVKALLAAGDLDERYPAAVRSAADFVFEDLEYTEFEDGARIKYVPVRGTDYYTLNAVALGAVLLLELHEQFGEERLRERATKILDYVVSRQTDRGGWAYRDPPSASHLSMDNHHNGFVVESLLRFRELTGSDRYDDAIETGLSFYRNELFEPNGAPNFDETNAYPRDIHAAAQGIIVFNRAGDPEFAGRVLDWTLDNLYAGEGRFYFRKERFYTKRFTLMRWCQAWMAYALTTHLAADAGR